MHLQEAVRMQNHLMRCCSEAASRIGSRLVLDSSSTNLSSEYPSVVLVKLHTTFLKRRSDRSRSVVGDEQSGYFISRLIRLELKAASRLFFTGAFFLSLFFSLFLSLLYLYSRENETAGARKVSCLRRAISPIGTTFTFLVTTIREIQMSEIDVGSQRF